jgi:hypothetical protein
MNPSYRQYLPEPRASQHGIPHSIGCTDPSNLTMNKNVTEICGPGDHAVLTDPLSRRWQERRGYCVRDSSLEAAWRLKSSGAALEMYWSLREAYVVSAGLGRR